ncbi:MAG: cytochrome C assembly family protein [Desulfovibrio sp.]
MGFNEIFDLLIIGLYLLGSMAYFAGILSQKSMLRRAGCVFAVSGFALHTVDLALLLFSMQAGAFTAGNFYFSFLSWSILLIYFFLWWRLRIDFLALTASPVALVLFVTSIAARSIKVAMPKVLSGPFFGLHIGTIFICLGLLAMAFGAGIAFLYIDRMIKTKSPIKLFGKDMPSLDTFDKVNAIAVTAGFPLYTLGVISGFIWARMSFGTMFTWNAQEVASLVIWFVYCFIFHQRVAIGWRGRKPAVMVIWLFVITVAVFAAINYFSPTHHSFRP